MRIAFIHPHKAFLPEIDAYQNFFSTYNIETIVCKPGYIANADVEWHFMGTDRSNKKKSAIKIHEFASASLPPFRKLKDFLKKTFSAAPDFRLFLNEYVMRQLNLNDSIPFGFRDMGVSFSDKKYPEIKYDFIYCGSVSGDMHINKLLKHFIRTPLQEKKLLILSRDYEKLKQFYKNYGNIMFKGPVEKKEVAGYIQSARFAINYKPDIEPHSHQTSTKFLEYAACNVPIITSDFEWMRNFQKKYGGNYFYLKPDLSNFTWENIIGYKYFSPDLSSWIWERQIRKSGVLEFLQSEFPQLSF